MPPPKSAESAILDGVPRAVLLTKYGVLLSQLCGAETATCSVVEPPLDGIVGWTKVQVDSVGRGAGERDGLRESSEGLHLHEQNSRVAYADGDGRWGYGEGEAGGIGDTTTWGNTAEVLARMLGVVLLLAAPEYAAVMGVSHGQRGYREGCDAGGWIDEAVSQVEGAVEEGYAARRDNREGCWCGDGCRKM